MEPRQDLSTYRLLTWAGLVLWSALWFTSLVDLSAPSKGVLNRLRPKPLSSFARRISLVKALIPERGTYGFITNEGDLTTELYQAQYMLAPRILVPGTRASIIIGDIVGNPSEFLRTRNLVIEQALGHDLFLLRPIP